MAYNLIDEKWIPVARQSGKVEMVAPAQIVERHDPPLRIASPRPDFDGALLEFLIGLLQTAATPSCERKWEEEFENPPSVEVLKERLDTVREAFFLDGEGPRFMQDLSVDKESNAKTWSISALLIDHGKSESDSKSPALFAKPGLVNALGYPAAAAALMTMQAYAPSGGSGHRTSIRGGGPLTSLIIGHDLWTTSWLNVFPSNDFNTLVPGDSSNCSRVFIFPWLGATRVSGNSGSDTHPQEVHPLQHLWGLPRRIRLIFDKIENRCDISGENQEPIVRSFHIRKHGTNYDGDFRHPWTPYTETKKNEPWNPKKGSSEGLPYRDWPLLATKGTKSRPAAIVEYFSTSRRRELVSHPRLLAFGYAMDNMKPLRWCVAQTPLITVAEHLASDFASSVEALVAASEEVRKTLSTQIKSAWSDDVRRKMDVFEKVKPAFWSSTESAFFKAVYSLKTGIENDNVQVRDEAKEAWLAELHQAALQLFKTFAQISIEIAAPDLRQVITAQRNLNQFTCPSLPKLRKLLGLPVEQIAKSKKTPRARKANK